jgi:RNA polymerase sigma-70 factor, ECF subfamily
MIADAAITTVFRQESPKIIASLTRIVKDVGRAEEIAQDAVVSALEEWPKSGLPDNPGAWLMVAAKNRALTALRRDKLLDRKHDEIAYVEAYETGPDIEALVDDDVGDDMLRLVFTACHPALPIESRVALTLRLVGGLTTEEIARAFLVPTPTIAQRIVRAKKTITDERLPYEVPSAAELPQRLEAVFGVVYLIFNEGYSATAGDSLLRPELTSDALRLGRLLTELVPEEPEAHGLSALMQIQASRAAARVGPDGAPILLVDQDRSKWDTELVRGGLEALARAEARRTERGTYTLQAAIAACHARAKTAAETDWARIADLYGELAVHSPSPVVELNRGVAIAMAHGPAAGLAVIDAVATDPSLQHYPFLPGARGDLLEKLGRLEEARREFERAASLTKNERERKLFEARARQNMTPSAR